MTDDITRTHRVDPQHVAGPDALIVELDHAPWGRTEFGLTFEQADALADHLHRAVASFRDH